MYKNEEMKILVIIPAYNEEKNIKETVDFFLFISYDIYTIKS